MSTVKPVSNGHSQKDPKLVFKTNNRLMQVKSIAECSKVLFVIKIFVLSIVLWPFYIGFTVVNLLMFAVRAIVVQNEELLFLIETSIRENLSTFNVSCDILTKLIQSSNIVQVGTTKNRFRKLKV